MSVGVICPKCRSPSSSVIDSRGSTGNIRRRRRCDRCSNRFTTVEIAVADTVNTHARIRAVETDLIRAEVRAEFRDEIVQLLQALEPNRSRA